MWYYQIDGQQEGPVPADTLRLLCDEGSVSDLTLVWQEGMDDWSPLRDAAPELCSPDPVPAPAPYQPAAQNVAPSPYPAGRYRPYPGPPPGQGAAVTSMICGILGIVFLVSTCCVPLTLVLGIVAMMQAGSARKASEGTGDTRALGMATAGKICGVVTIALSLVGVLFVAAYFGLIFWFGTAGYP